MSKSEKKKKKKIKIPKTVLQLEWSPKKFAKKHNIRVSEKGMNKKEKKHAKKRLNREYGDFAIANLNKAVKILSENQMEDNKKIDKVKNAVESIVSNSEVMKTIAKRYTKERDQFPNLIYLPYMITNTILYYSREDLTVEEKAIADSLNKEELIEFCETILKKQIKVYRNNDLSNEIAFQIATVIPTAKRLKGNNQWYKRLIQTLYTIAEYDDVDVEQVFNAILKIDKKKVINKKEFYENFFSEFIMTKASNKVHSFNDKQKELHETLLEQTAVYLNSRKPKQLKEILKRYIKRRKTAESYKNDNKRVIKFIDFANSNSEYTNLKAVIQELIEDNSTNELYLG
jgi:hypothetical protein